MSTERWGVTFYDRLLGERRRWVENGRPWVGSYGEAVGKRLLTCAADQARVVKLVPKVTKAQRRVFEGEVVQCPDGAELLLADSHYYNIKEACGGIGKRVRLTVTVLPDGATDAKGGVTK